MSYIQGILRDWNKKGYKNLADINNEKKNNKVDLEEKKIPYLYGTDTTVSVSDKLESLYDN